jgi:DNA end-binding protein Ku
MAKKIKETPAPVAPMSIDDICADLLGTSSTVAPRPKMEKKAATHATFSGSLYFGTMECKVKAYTATEIDKVSFKSLHSCGSPLKQGAMHCPVCDVDVDRAAAQKGYEISKGEYVVVTKEEIEACEICGTDKLKITTFTEASEIDPIYFESTGFLAPEEGALNAKVFALLRAGMVSRNRVAVAEYSQRGRQYHVVIRPITLTDGKEGMAISYLYQENEVRTSNAWVKVQLSDKEAELAGKLVDGLTDKFDVTEHYDGYTANLRQVIASKINKTAAPTFVKQVAAPAPKMDILAALAASLEVASNVRKGRLAKKSA